MRTRGQDIAWDAIHEGMTEEEIACAIDQAIAECKADAKTSCAEQPDDYTSRSLDEAIKCLGQRHRPLTDADFTRELALLYNAKAHLPERESGDCSKLISAARTFLHKQNFDTHDALKAALDKIEEQGRKSTDD